MNPHPVSILLARAPTFASLSGDDSHASAGGGRPLVRLCVGLLPLKRRLLWSVGGSGTRRLVESLCDEIGKASSAKEVEEAVVYWERRQEIEGLRWKLWQRHFVPPCETLVAHFAQLLTGQFPRIGARELRVFAGESVSLMLVEAPPGASFQWQRDGANLPGESASLLHHQAVDPTAAGSYRVIAKTPDGIEISNEVTLKVVAELSPGVVRQPREFRVRPGESWSAAVEIEGVGKMEYSWEFNGQPIPGAHEPTLQIGRVADHNFGTYRLRIRNTHGSTVTDDIVLRPEGRPAAEAVKSRPGQMADA